MVIQNGGPMHPMAKEVLYIGSAVPLETSSGLEAVQQPLRSRYPTHDEDIQGIPSILTVLPGGIQLKYIEDPSHVVFFPYSALNMCAAVRCVTTTDASTHEIVNKFVSLTDSPTSERPAIFTTMTRRTQGRHVLECSGYLTKKPSDALELVQWTSAADKKSKMGGAYISESQSTVENSHSHSAFNSAYDSKTDTSFHTEMSSSQDTPVHIVPGNNVSQAAKPASYNELPKNGYFYTTQSAQVRKYSLQKFSKEPAPQPPPPQQQQPPQPEPIQPIPVVEPAPTTVTHTNEEHERTHHTIVNGDAHFDRRSTYSMPATSRPPTKLIAVRGPPPPGMPIMMGAPPPPRPYLMRPPGPQIIVRPPPPPMMMARPPMYAPMHPMARTRPVPMMMPVPMPYHAATLPNPKAKASRHRRSSSSESTSSETSSTSQSGRDKSRHHIARRDHSFESGSRPVTPPTDYEYSPPRRFHSSRKDEFQHRQQRNGYAGDYMTLMPPRGRGLPPGYVMLPTYANGGGIYGAPTLPRSKSVPAHGERSSKKDKKSKKKKGKKDKKHKHGQHVSNQNFFPDSYIGYSSDFGPGTGPSPMTDASGYYAQSSARQFGDTNGSNLGKSFSRNAAERSFANSLMAETRRSTRRDPFNAYAMNQNGGDDGEFLP